MAESAEEAETERTFKALETHVISIALWSTVMQTRKLICYIPKGGLTFVRKNVLAFFHKYCSLIGYATSYLF